MIIKNGLVLLGVSMMLVGCGGSGSSVITTPDDNTLIPDNNTTTPGGNILPVVDAGEDRTIEENTDTTMTGTASDADGAIVSYQWTENGITLSTEAIFTYTEVDVGAHELTLTVTDDEGGTAQDTVNITVEAEAGPEFIPYDAPTISQALITEYLDAVNAARAQVQDCDSYGIFQPASPVTWSDELYKASSEHSYDIAVLGETSPDFDHDGTGTASDWTAQVLELNRGSKFWERAENNGYDNASRYAVGENVHASPTNITEAMDGWMASGGHCANIMNPDATQVGVAMVENQDAIWLNYWTQVFGQEL